MQPPSYQRKTLVRIRTTYSTRQPAQFRRVRNVAVGLSLFGLLFFGWLGVTDIRTLQDLLAHGRAANALITDKRAYHGKSTSYYLYYTFDGGETLVTSRASVSYRDYSTNRVGDWTLVTYLPANPHTNRWGRVDAARVQRAEWGWMIGLSLFLAVPGILFLAATAQLRKERCRLTGP